MTSNLYISTRWVYYASHGYDQTEGKSHLIDHYPTYISSAIVWLKNIIKFNHYFWFGNLCTWISRTSRKSCGNNILLSFPPIMYSWTLNFVASVIRLIVIVCISRSPKNQSQTLEHQKYIMILKNCFAWNRSKYMHVYLIY